MIQFESGSKIIRLPASDRVKMEARNYIHEASVVRLAQGEDKVVKADDELKWLIQEVGKPSWPQCVLNRLACPSVGGYLQFNDVAYYNCVIDYYNLLVNNDIGDVKCLNQNAIVKPYYGDSIGLQSLNFKDDFNTEEYAAMKTFWKKIFDLSISTGNIEDMKFPSKKATTPSGPRTLIDGTHWNASQFDVGLSVRGTSDVFARYCRNYLPLKQHMIELISTKDHYDRFIKFHSTSITDIISHGLKYVKDATLNISKTGVRANQVRTPEEDVFNSKMKYKGQVLYPRTRHINLMHNNKMIEGDIDVQRYCDDYLRFLPKPLLYRDLRQICNAWFMVNAAYLPYTRLLLSCLEKGKYSFLSLRDDVIERRRRYCSKAKSYSFRIKVRMDTTNSDKFINSNSEKFFNLIPDDYRDFWEHGSLCLQLLPYGAIYQSGVNSGTAFTTINNVIFGLRRVFTVLRDWLGVPIHSLCDAYIKMVEMNLDGFTVMKGNSEYYCYVPLGTDDQICEIASNTALDVNLAKQSYPSLKLSFNDNDEHEFFGMVLNDEGCSVDKQAQVSKLFLFEQPGFYTKDIFSLYARLEIIRQFMGSDLTRDILKIIKKYLGIDSSDLTLAKSAFFSDLAKMGLSVGDVINTYSPKEMVVYGSAVSFNIMEAQQKVTDKELYGIVKANPLLPNPIKL